MCIEKLKNVSRILCKKFMLLRIKKIFQNVRSTLSYGAERWVMRGKDDSKLKTTETTISRMLCGKTLKNKVSNGKTRKVTGVKSIGELVREQML